MKPILTHPSWGQIDKACALLANKVLKDDFEPSIIIGLARGGLIPAVIISHILEIKMFPISYSSKVGNGEYKGYQNDLPQLGQIKNVLIVDDIADTGNTLKEVVQFYKHHQHEVKSAVLYHKEGSVITPDYVWQTIPEDSDWIIFPFEI